MALSAAFPIPDASFPDPWRSFSTDIEKAVSNIDQLSSFSTHIMRVRFFLAITGCKPDLIMSGPKSVLFDV
jgi:hypothetical protein